MPNHGMKRLSKGREKTLKKTIKGGCTDEQWARSDGLHLQLQVGEEHFPCFAGHDMFGLG